MASKATVPPENGRGAEQGNGSAQPGRVGEHCNGSAQNGRGGEQGNGSAQNGRGGEQGNGSSQGQGHNQGGFDQGQGPGQTQGRNPAQGQNGNGADQAQGRNPGRQYDNGTNLQDPGNAGRQFGQGQGQQNQGQGQQQGNPSFRLTEQNQQQQNTNPFRQLNGQNGKLDDQIKSDMMNGFANLRGTDQSKLDDFFGRLNRALDDTLKNELANKAQHELPPWAAALKDLGVLDSFLHNLMGDMVRLRKDDTNFDVLHITNDRQFTSHRFDQDSTSMSAAAHTPVRICPDVSIHQQR